MSLYKRKGSPNWWIAVSVNGRRVQKSAGTADRVQAQEYHDRVKAEMWRVTRLGDTPTYYWEQAVLQYLAEAEGRKSVDTDRCRLRVLHKYLEGRPLGEIASADVEDAIRRGQKDRHVVWTVATCNRYRALVRAVLRRAQRSWQWIDSAPHIPLAREDNRRTRFLRHDEAAALIEAAPPHLRPVIRFALATGLRRRNVLGLKWTEVDMPRGVAWVHPDEAKAGRAIGVPLNSLAMAVLEEQKNVSVGHVFTWQGKPISAIGYHTWRKTLHRAGLPLIKFHDLRHTWASWHAMAGTTVQELQALGGWSSAEMVQRYAHLAQDHLHGAAERIVDTKLLQHRKVDQ